jgi:hypothetical protein
MKSKLFNVVILTILAVILAGCSKSEDPLTATPNRAVGAASGVSPAGKAPVTAPSNGVGAAPGVAPGAGKAPTSVGNTAG